MSQQELNPKTTHYEFLGPPGAFLISIGVPITAYALYFGCSEATGCPSFSGVAIIQALTSLDWWVGLWDTQAAIAYVCWYAFCVLSWAFLPGDVVTGTPLRDGGRKQYKINGTTFVHIVNGFYSSLCPAFSTFLLALGIASGIILRFGPESFTFIYYKWVGLVTAALLMSFLQATYCYISSFERGKLLALGGNSDNLVYDVNFPPSRCQRFVDNNGIVVYRT